MRKSEEPRQSARRNRSYPTRNCIIPLGRRVGEQAPIAAAPSETLIRKIGHQYANSETSPAGRHRSQGDRKAHRIFKTEIAFMQE
jgi:hypothetical protein